MSDSEIVTNKQECVFPESLGGQISRNSDNKARRIEMYNYLILI